MIETVSDNIGGKGYDQNWYRTRFFGPLTKNQKVHFGGSIERRWLGDRRPSSMTDEILPGNPKRLPGNWLDGWSYHGKIDFQIAPQLQTEFAIDRTIDKWSEYRHEFLYDIDHTPRYEDKNIAISGSVQYSITTKSKAEFSAAYFESERIKGDGIVFDDLEAYQRPELYWFYNPYWDDLNLFREADVPIYNPDLDSIIGLADSYWEEFLHHKSSYIQLKGFLEREISTDVKTALGFDYRRYTLRYFHNLDATNYDSPVSLLVSRYGYDVNGNETDDLDFKNETKHPNEIGLFLQTNIKRESVNINLGLRLDRFDLNSLQFADPLAPFDGPGSSDPDSLDLGDLVETKIHYRFSPRLQVAISATDRLKVGIDLSVSYQQAPFEYYFAGLDFVEARTYAGSFTTFATPNIEPEKVTLLQTKLHYQVSEMLSISASAYAKDYDNQLWVQHLAAVPTSRDTYSNTDHGSSQGFEFDLAYDPGKYARFDIGYSISRAKGTGTFPTLYYATKWTNTGNTLLEESILDYDKQHRINTVLSINTGKSEGLAVGNIHPFENISFTALVQAESGLPYSLVGIYDAVREGMPISYISLDEINTERMKWNYTIDFKLEKQFFWNGATIAPFVIIKNLLDRDNVWYVYPATGEPDDCGWLATGEGQGWLEDVEGASRYGMTAEEAYNLKENDPRHYGPPRQIFFGLRVGF